MPTCSGGRSVRSSSAPRSIWCAPIRRHGSPPTPASRRSTRRAEAAWTFGLGVWGGGRLDLEARVAGGAAVEHHQRVLELRDVVEPRLAVELQALGGGLAARVGNLPLVVDQIGD